MAKAIAEDLKWRIILLYNDGYSRKQIAKLLYIGETLVKKGCLYIWEVGLCSKSMEIYTRKKKSF